MCLHGTNNMYDFKLLIVDDFGEGLHGLYLTEKMLRPIKERIGSISPRVTMHSSTTMRGVEYLVPLEQKNYCAYGMLKELGGLP